LYYTASGIIKSAGGRPVHRLRGDSIKLYAGRPQVERGQSVHRTVTYTV